MNSKLVILAIFASLAVIHGAKLGHETNTILAPVEKEGRLIEVPIIGTLVLKSLKVVWYLLSTAFSLIGYKVAALALVANLIYWAFSNCFSVILGALAMLGFCKLTDKCSFNYLPQEIVEVGDTLVYAARSLESGVEKYGSI